MPSAGHPGRDPHQGGCFYCQHVEPTRMRCTHPGYPVPTPFDQARDDLERCGPRARWWAPRLELTPTDGPSEDTIA